MSIKDLDVKPRNEYVSIARTEIDEDEEEDYIGTHIEFHNIEINKNNDQLHHRKPKNEVPTTSNHRDPNDEIISSDEDRTDSSVTSTKWTVVSKDPSKSSNASCTSNLDDSDHLGKTLHQKSHVPNKTTTTQVSNDKLKKPTDPNLKKRSSRFKKNSIRASQTLMVPKEFCVVESSQKPSASIPKGDTYQLDHQVKFHNTDPILQRVPTEEERQKAFNQLRLFQTTQIKKIMRKKTPLSESRNDLNLTQFPETKNDVAVKPQLNWSPFRSIGVVSFNSPHTNKTADDYEENNSSTDSEDCLSKTDLLLSKLLDEDDEEMNDVKDQENEPCLCFNGVAPIGSWNSSHIPSGSSPLSNPFETRETSVWSTAQIKNLNSHSNSWGNM
uniref:Uncharacterized protein n=1 Tax=Eucampia antarctica TaxID=49252 RepID=A0A7S2R1X8_9STRA